MSRKVDVRIGDSTHTIEEPRLRRSKLIGRQVQELFKQVPNLEMEIEKFSRQWEQQTAYKLDRTAAKAQFGSRLLYEPRRNEAGEIELDEDDHPILVPKVDPETGAYVYGPDELAGLSEEDWAGSGHVLPRYQSPSDSAVLLHMFSLVYDKAEEPLMELLGLMLCGNTELRDTHKAGPKALRELIDSKRDLLEDEGDIGDMVALAWETYELLREQIEREKVKLGKLRALLPGGNQPEATAETSDQAETDSTGTTGKPASSTSSSPSDEADTPGASTTSSSESSSSSLVAS